MDITICDDGTTIVWSDCICSLTGMGTNPYCPECYTEVAAQECKKHNRTYWWSCGACDKEK